MTEEGLRQSIVRTAQSWIGWNERDNSHCKVIDLYNTFRPVPRGYRLKYSDPWCAATVSALAISTGLTETIPVECSCIRQLELFQKRGCWVESDGYLPRPGDVLYYDWDDREGPQTDDRGAPEHVGVIETAVNGRLTVIEGNFSDRVGRRTVAVNGRFIRGFGTPDYGTKAASISIRELERLQVITAPEYWRQEILLQRVPYLGELFCRASEHITEKGPRTETEEEGLERLVQCGVIGKPDYWSAVMNREKHVGALLCALGGSVSL